MSEHKGLVTIGGRSFPRRRVATGCAVWLVCGGIVSAIVYDANSRNQQDANSTQMVGNASAPAISEEPVEAGCANTKQSDFAVVRDGRLLTAPRDGAAPAMMRIGASEAPAPLESGATVRVVCRSGVWAKVRVLTLPKELQPLQGWTRASFLRPVQTTAAGRRIYQKADFEWPEGSAAYRSAAVTVMNRIMAEQPACEALDRSSLVFDRETRTFSIPCFDNADMRSFDFTPADASNGRSFAPATPVEPIGKMEAIDACKAEFTRRAAHPSTVDFPMLDYDHKILDSGASKLLMSAQARNGFGLELSYDVECDFHGSEITDYAASEARE